jgi:hypothetical protein
MNNIGRPPGPTSTGTGFPAQDAFGGLGGNVGDRRSLHSDLLEGESLEFDEEATGSSHTATEREADFLRSFRAAVRGSKRDAEDEGQGTQGQQTPEPRVLAVSEQLLWTGLPSPADASSGPGVEPKRPSTEAMVTSVMEQIDRAIRAEMAPRAGMPMSLNIAFADESSGLTGLRVIITQTTLDVIFERAEAVASEELVRAADALAQRLMTRFSKRTVRILETATSHGEDAGDGQPVRPALNLFP